MGLGIVVTDYTNTVFDRVDDPKNILHRLLPPCREESAIVWSRESIGMGIPILTIFNWDNL
jgi:hypothetical protein